MTTLTIRPYQDEADLQAIVKLLNICETIDQYGNYHTVENLQLEFTEPGTNPQEDCRLWEDAAGTLLAFAQIWIPQETIGDILDGFLWFRILPAARQDGLEPPIFRWAETRLQTVAQERKLIARLNQSCREYEHDRIALLENHGFMFERCFLRMGRSLSEPIPEVALPEGFTLAYTRPNIDAAARVDAYNQSFIDHWNFHPETAEMYQHWQKAPNYQPEFDLVAVAPDGTFAAFCYCEIDAEENRQLDRQDGWIHSLGVRRGYRRMGLGRAMLVAGLRKLKAEGAKIVKLGVDTENPNQAQTLYESVGFEKLFASLTYAKICS